MDFEEVTTVLLLHYQLKSFHIQTQKCLQVISLSDRVLCLHSAWNILFVGLASGSVANFALKVS